MEQEDKKLTPKEKRFCEEYMVDLNATRAAIRAGYSAHSARNIGYHNVTKVHIREFLTEKLKEKSLLAEETTKLLSDIAKSSLNDFFTITQIEHTPRILKPVAELVKQLEAEIIFEDEFAAQAGLENKEKEAHETMQKDRRRTLIRYQIELKNKSSATRIVDGPIEMVEHAELDMVKLVKAKESGRIKSISHTQFGIKVELYAADAALIALARIHGLFIDNIRHSGTVKIGKELEDETYV